MVTSYTNSVHYSVWEYGICTVSTKLFKLFLKKTVLLNICFTSAVTLIGITTKILNVFEYKLYGYRAYKKNGKDKAKLLKDPDIIGI